jgi:hypothetical protein
MGAAANASRTLEQRLRPIEDRLETYNLIGSVRPGPIPAPKIIPPRCGPRTACSTAVPSSRPTGRIASGSSNSEHHRAIGRGIAHFAVCADH